MGSRYRIFYQEDLSLTMSKFLWIIYSTLFKVLLSRWRVIFDVDFQTIIVLILLPLPTTIYLSYQDPARENLRIMRVILDHVGCSCGLCDGSLEQTLHLFLTCPISSSLWYMNFWWSGKIVVLPGDIVSLYKFFVPPYDIWLGLQVVLS